MVFEQLLDPVFNPLLSLNPFLAVTLVSFLISLIVVLIYKFTTNQNLMKQLKDEMKELQKEMKALQKEPEKMMKIQGKVMETNMKYMSQSLKSSLFTLLPVIIIFAWMNAHYAFNPIAPNDQFQVLLSFDKNTVGNVSIDLPSGITSLTGLTQPIANDKAAFLLKGVEGNYIQNNSLKIDYNNMVFYKDVMITNNPSYAPKDTPVKNSALKIISLDYKKKIILPVLNWGWLGTYILESLVFSMALRKLFNVY